MSTKNITIIGGGNLGASIAEGLTAANNPQFGTITVADRSAARLEHLRSIGISTTNDNVAAIQAADLVIMCVQPQQLDKALEETRDAFDKEKHVLVSTVTGVDTSQISALAGPDVCVVRAMPNTATAIRESMTCLCSSNASETQMKLVEEVFRAIGETIVIGEQLMQAATVLGASGIAFFLRFLRAATQGGIQMGFHPHEAQLIAVQTAIGATKLVKERHDHPEVEIDKVTTPRGCTIEGLNEMEHQGLSSAVIKGLMASYQKINNIR